MTLYSSRGLSRKLKGVRASTDKRDGDKVVCQSKQVTKDGPSLSGRPSLMRFK